MKTKFVLAATTALSLAYIGTASADVIQQGIISSEPSTNFYPSTSVSLTKYDNTTLPALDAITITVTTQEAANISISNSSGTPYAFTSASATVGLLLFGPGGVSTYLTTSATQASGTAAPGITDFAGLTGTTSYTTTISAANFSAFEGPSGTVAFTFESLLDGASFSGSTGAPSNTLYFGGGANLGVTVTVDYSNAPEPASMALFGTAMAGLGVIRRRRSV